MDVNIWAVIAATVTMFAIGAFWYMVPFGKAWGKIHDFDKLSKKEQKEMQAKMGPWYGAQLVVTVMSAFVLAKMMILLPGYSAYTLAFMLWLGFVLPTEASAMIFGGSKPEYVWHKIFISSSEALVHLMAAAWVIGLIQK